MYVYLKMIDVENRFHNWVRESEKAVLVPVSTKEITADHDRGKLVSHAFQDQAAKNFNTLPHHKLTYKELFKVHF